MTTPIEGTIVSLSRMNYVFEGDIIARIAPHLGEHRVAEHEEAPPIRRKW